MTKEEFVKYVKSFNKKSGEYSLDDLVKIGTAHKNLDLKDKNWQELVDTVGWGGSKDSFRVFINKHTVNKDGKYEYTDYDKLFIAKTQARDSYNALRQTLRDEARIADFKDFIVEKVAELPKLPKMKVTFGKSVKTAQNEAILNFSDLHMGGEFKNSYNSYNYNTAVERVTKLTEEVIKYCKEFNVRRLNILNLGDCISGAIHETLRYEQQIDVVSQTMKAAELVADMLNNLQVAAPEITYRSVSDNHSRITPDKTKSIEIENFSRVIDWFIKERLKDTKIKFIDDNLDYGIGKFNLVNGKRVMFAHGHQDNKHSVVQDFTAVAREIPDYIILAHYHSSAEKTFNSTKVFVNGSIIGCDSYAYGKRLFGEPEQKLLIFNDNNVVDININLK